ncbi:MAG: hypothetical protein IM662_13275 [Phenylobacterium sp.]|nr:hypothetical protein [Phenylobacterium sp.]
MNQFEISDFPRAQDSVLCVWAPVLFHPIPTSPERLIIGIVACDKGSARLVPANGLDRLNCLFGKLAPEIIALARLTLDAIEEDISKRGVDVVRNFIPPMSGTTLGDVRQAEGRTPEEVASYWLEATCALHERSRGFRPFNDPELPIAAANYVPRALNIKRLRAEIRVYVTDQKENLKLYFREQNVRSSPIISAARPILDYSGHHVAANFGVLNTNHASTLNGIKRRMWDLSIDRIRSEKSAHREHEMIVHYPSLTESGSKILQGVKSALKDLESEADISEIRFRPLTSVKEIGDHLLKMELAA